MRVVAVLAITGLIALVIAVLTGSTWAAAVVIVSATAGIVLLLRDWRSERSRSLANLREPVPSAAPGAMTTGAPLTVDEFSPDLSTDPDGPSSDARAG